MMSLSKEKGMESGGQTQELDADRNMDTLFIIPDEQKKYMGEDAGM